MDSGKKYSKYDIISQISEKFRKMGKKRAKRR